MTQKINDFSSKGLGTAAILAISQGLPPFLGYPIASILSLILGNRFLSPTFSAIRLNQWVVHDGKLNSRELQRAVRRVYQNQGRALYDFYHNLDRPDAIRKLVRLTPRFTTLMEGCQNKESKQGTLLLIPHLSGFNLGGLLLAQLGFKFLTLAIPNPNRDYAWQNKIRNERGMEVLPMNFSSLQSARERLQKGGTVQTGVDRAHPESGYTPLFFGRPAPLPVAYVQLALKTNARVIVVNFCTLADHTYQIDCSDAVELEPNPDRHAEMIRNAEKILRIVEDNIRSDPSQWMMFLPLWPGLEKELPSL
ncbi:MAG: lysophospholipid acyltransferase family protein [Chloroflexi bacterium]|nr:lysophospholipid acyltransferase family protein [Chloroflexota bacterium]